MSQHHPHPDLSGPQAQPSGVRLAAGQRPASGPPHPLEGEGVRIGDSVSRVERIRAALQSVFAPERLEVIDDSQRHAGHAGARDGRGHFNVEIVSDAFAGMRPLARHRAVYAAVGTMMDTDIHALSIQARTPEEVAGM